MRNRTNTINRSLFPRICHPSHLFLLLLGLCPTEALLNSNNQFAISSQPARRRAFDLAQQQTLQTRTTHARNSYLPALSSDSNDDDTDESSSSLSNNVQAFAESCQALDGSLTKGACKVAPALVSGGRLGLVATQSIGKGEVVLQMPYAESALTAQRARTVFQNVLPDKYDGWTGDTGLLALLLLNEVALASGSGGVSPSGPARSDALQSMFTTWIATLPHPDDEEATRAVYPLLWPEDDQEILQSSSTTKLYRRLDDLEEDAAWLDENIFAKDRATFPEHVTLSLKDNDNNAFPCFSLAGLTWAYATVQSRCFFLDGSVKLLPLLDMVNHDDDAQEVRAGYMGPLRNIQGAQLVADRPYRKGQEVKCSYGPKSAADYLLEHGFVPEQCWRTKVSEITLEMDPEDRFYDDKLDILEFETYSETPMDPIQSFDLVAAPGQNDGEPDPALVQFVRLQQLGGTDAFLLESIFRKEVWGFMAYPVSEINELAVVNTIAKVCEDALAEFDDCPKDRGSEHAKEICAKVRDAETTVLSKTVSFLKREKEALDLKEYYQERRLKDLGLDSEWSPEDDDAFGSDSDLGFGQTRAPGGADYDW